MTYSTQFQTAPMEGRFAWCWLGVKRTTTMDGKPRDTPRYECGFYFPKLSADRNQDRNYGFFAGLAWDVVTNAYRGTWPMINPRTGEWDEWPIDDCDFPANIEKYPWQKGMWKIGLSGGTFQPRIFDIGNNIIKPGLDGKYRPDHFKADDNSGGDWGMVSVNAYEWSYGNTRKGVSFGLEAIKVTRQDEQIGGAAGRPVEQIFGAPTGQPVYGGAPPIAPPLPGPAVPPTQGYGAAPPYAPTATTAPPSTPPVAPAPHGGGMPLGNVGYGPAKAYPSSAAQWVKLTTEERQDAPPPYAPGAQPPSPYPGAAPGMPPVPPQFGQR